MNKTQLVDALAVKLGDRRAAAGAVDGLLETIVETVRSGDSVSLTGFGVFTSRARAARVARNPRTGETVNVPATTVPAFRPGAAFRTAVSSAGPATSARTSAARSVATAQVDTDEKPDERAKAKQDDRTGDKADKAAKAAKKSAKAKDSKPKKGKKK